MIGSDIEKSVPETGIADAKDKLKITENAEKRAELPDDSGDRIYKNELPDDSGDNRPELSADEANLGKICALARKEGRLSENAIQAIRVGEDGIATLTCRNEELAGKTHEVTGVPYVEKTIAVGSIQLRVVVPEFPCKFQTEIPEELMNAGDRKIFEYCTEQLRDAIQKNPELGKQFTSQQLEQIMAGEPYIKGLSWHHTEIPGKMQLVDAKIHGESGHTGGNTIWGSGIR